ncbi:hypothetical protein SCHPADRAFT_934282 [Schizopora paradoxa]|uniref:Uncharacterized protein n=1 Tax=Schizopora paradoxa TaxID=27342 RepID=A0A0H2S880_9AGAM|nr:hypothetical protein SCHPADRAFT_934282 [Schizopora paradoxa]
MPDGDNAKAAPAEKPAKRVTRSTFRSSLNFASVEKALAHVMNKDNKESKESKKEAAVERRKSTSSPKDVQSRRSSTIGFGRSNSVLEPVVEGRQRQSSVDLPTITKARRSSALIQRAASGASGRASLDDTGSRTSSDTPTASSSLTRTTSSLRPKSGAPSTSLPKYRPKSIALDTLPKKPSSPVRAGTRRKHSSSEEEGMPANVTCAFVVHTPAQKPTNRPISPIPKRAVKSGISPPQKLTPTINAPTRSQSSPVLTQARSKKSAKPSDSPDSTKRGIPKHSPLGTSPSATPGTPRTPTLVKGAARYLNALTGRESPSPLRGSKISNSPSRKSSKASLAGGSLGKAAAAEVLKGKSTASSSANSFVGDVSSDSIDAGDVEYLLACSASPSAPTPAIPRMRSFFAAQIPETPSRLKRNASKSTLGLTLSPPDELPELPSPSSRSSSPRRLEVIRDSVAAWSKVADDSMQIDATELGGLILDMPAPFLPNTPGMLSPSPSVMRLESGNDDVLASPSPKGLAPPNVFGSISQTLLPHFSPSPVVRVHEPEASTGDGKHLNVPFEGSNRSTSLRSQLASVENIAKEQSTRIAQLEEQLHALKEARAREVKDLGEQLTVLEEQLQESLTSRAPDREDRHLACKAELEQQLQLVEDIHRQSLDVAIAQAKAEQAAEERRKAEHARVLTETVNSASEKWQNVRSSAVEAAESIRCDREILAALLSSLSVHELHLKSGFAIPTSC